MRHRKEHPTEVRMLGLVTRKSALSTQGRLHTTWTIVHHTTTVTLENRSTLRTTVIRSTVGQALQTPSRRPATVSQCARTQVIPHMCQNTRTKTVTAGQSTKCRLMAKSKVQCIRLQQYLEPTLLRPSTRWQLIHQTTITLLPTITTCKPLHKQLQVIQLRCVLLHHALVTISTPSVRRCSRVSTTTH